MNMQETFYMKSETMKLIFKNYHHRNSCECQGSSLRLSFDKVCVEGIADVPTLTLGSLQQHNLQSSLFLIILNTKTSVSILMIIMVQQIRYFKKIP